MKSLRLSVFAAALLLGACSSPSPTDPAGLAPSFDEGPGMVGSGNFTGETQDGGGMLGSGTLTEDGPTDGGTEPDPTQRGVGTMGSGG